MMAGLVALKDGLNFASLRRMFYMVTPSETSFPTVSAVPPMVDMAIVWFFLFMGLEILINVTIGKSRRYSIGDSFTSMGGGLLQSCVKVLVRSVEFTLFCQIYETYHIVDLPWNSKWTWLVAFLGVDLAYYWLHRISHETILGWSFHQMHHSSEYYNLSTALRQGIFQQFFSMFFYFPLALFVPPPVHLVHTYLNLIYQFWIHTELIDRLGPLELIINTPSHHRVHHGRNPYCIDKNYAGTLIIWDRLFGTFQAEKKEEPVVYGLVHNVESFNQLYCQVFLFKYSLLTKPTRMKGWWNKVESLIRGPGWEPESAEDCIPQIEHPVVRYNPSVPVWINIYVALHFVVCLSAYMYISAQEQTILAGEIFIYVSFVAISLQSFGAFFDNKWFAGYLELARCSTVYPALIIAHTIPPTGAGLLIHSLFALSTSLWIVNAITSKNYQSNEKENLD